MKRIPIFEVKDGVPPENIKGVALNPQAGLLYVTTPRRMAALDLNTERVVWNRDFSLDGRYAYPSTGDIIDAKTRQIVGGLTDERGRAVQSENMVEAVYSGGRLVGAGDQFGVGRQR